MDMKKIQPRSSYSMSLVLEKLKLSNPSVKTSFSLQVFSPITLYMGKKESKYVIYHILA